MKKLFSNKSLFVVIVIAFFFIFAIPMIINELYKLDIGYSTLWNAADVLSYYSQILGGMISIIGIIITLLFGKKELEKELSYYASQVHTPFFVIESISDKSEENNFYHSLDGCWEKIVHVNVQDTISIDNDNQNIIRITMSNVGDGLALSLKCIFNEETLFYQAGVSQGDNCCVKIDLSSFFGQLCKEKDIDILRTEIQEKCFDLQIIYSNTLGITYSQSIDMRLVLIAFNAKLSIMIKDLSELKMMPREK